MTQELVSFHFISPEEFHHEQAANARQRGGLLSRSSKDVVLRLADTKPTVFVFQETLHESSTQLFKQPLCHLAITASALTKQTAAGSA